MLPQGKVDGGFAVNNPRVLPCSSHVSPPYSSLLFEQTKFNKCATLKVILRNPGVSTGDFCAFTFYIINHWWFLCTYILYYQPLLVCNQKSPKVSSEKCQRIGPTTQTVPTVFNISLGLFLSFYAECTVREQKSVQMWLLHLSCRCSLLSQSCHWHSITPRSFCRPIRAGLYLQVLDIKSSSVSVGDILNVSTRI